MEYRNTTFCIVSLAYYSLITRGITMNTIIRFNTLSKRLSQFGLTYECPIKFEGLEYPTLRHIVYATRYTRLDTYVSEGVKYGMKAAICDMTLQELEHLNDGEYPITNKDYHQEVYSNVKKAIKIRIEADTTGEFLGELLQTDNAVLLYLAPFDNYWGTGVNKQGANRLGCILEEIREEYRAENN